MSAGEQTREAFEGWCLLELMGHRKLAGFVREATIGGGSFVRVDVYTGAPGQVALPTLTQFYAPGAVYAITPVSEDLARRFAERQRPEPVAEWELPRPRLEAGRTVDAQAQTKCDGNHGAPACGDPECWQREFDDDDDDHCPHGLKNGDPCEPCARDDDAEAGVAAHQAAFARGEDPEDDDEGPEAGGL